MTDLDPSEWALPNGLSARLVTEADDPLPALPETERVRMASFGHPSRRSQFALGRLAARSLAANRLGLDPRVVPLAVAEDGAPTLPDLSVSIAHTGRAGTVAALAAVADRTVGVDLERIAPRRPDLWRRILTDDERPLLARLGGPTDEVQTLLWTLKEAVLKAQRTGFRAGGKSVHLSIGHRGGPGRGGLASATSGAGEWQISFGRQGDLWLAVAWSADAPSQAEPVQEKQTP